MSIEPNDGPGRDGRHIITGECFACMVGVATGPESHAADCLSRDVEAWCEHYGHGYTHDDDTLCTCGTWVGGRPFRNTPGRRSMAEHQADMLAAAGLLVTPEHDAQVAARAWDEAAEAARRERAAAVMPWEAYMLTAVDAWLSVRAEAERTGGGV